MRLTLIQMNSRTAARDENVERACAFIGQAAEAESDLVILGSRLQLRAGAGHSVDDGSGSSALQKISSRAHR